MTDTETETRTPFPERMHRLSVDTHTRRAKKALSDLAGESAGMALALENGRAIEPEGARKLGELAAMICGHLGALEVLREHEEWEEAEKNG